MQQKPNKNLRWDIINDKCISTIFRQIYVPYMGSYSDSWETFVWNWDYEKKDRGKLVGEYYHGSKKRAIEVHNRLLRIYSYLTYRKYRGGIKC